MNLLVSDYDGTLNSTPSFISNINVNINYIRQFMSDGNKFMLSTGRNFPSIIKEIKKYDIPFDYLSVNDGAVLYNGNLEKIAGFYIDEKQVVEIIRDVYDHVIGENFRLYGMNGQVDRTDSVLEIMITTSLFSSLDDLDKLKSIVERFPELEIMNLFNIHIIKNTGGKSKSIGVVDDLIHPDRIYTIGDGRNDLEMLQDFEGYKVPFSEPCLYGKKIKTISSVKSLIKKIMLTEK